MENARGLGRHLAQWLVARGERVDDVPSTATARVRELSRGGRRKNDVIDAAAAASVAALHGDGNPVVAENQVTVLALLDERRRVVEICQPTTVVPERDRLPEHERGSYSLPLPQREPPNALHAEGEDRTSRPEAPDTRQ